MHCLHNLFLIKNSGLFLRFSREIFPKFGKRDINIYAISDFKITNTTTNHLRPDKLSCCLMYACNNSFQHDWQLCIQFIKTIDLIISPMQLVYEHNNRNIARAELLEISYPGKKKVN